MDPTGPTAPPLSRWLREPVNALTHGVGVLLAIAGLVVLVVLSDGEPWRTVAFAIYGATMVLLYLASTVMHAAKVRPGVLRWLRLLDHAAIFLLIAGTYTPICLHFFEGAWRWGMLITIWSMAAAGIGVKLFIVRAPRAVTAGVYLLMGWLALAGVREILSAMPVPAIVWLLAGGLFFTVGALVYITRRPDPFPGVFGFHELWHIFVLLGCLSHYILIAAFVAAGGGAG